MPDAFVSCACGETYTRDQWKRLPFVGEQLIPATESEPAMLLQYKNCRCSSTISVDLNEDSPPELSSSASMWRPKIQTVWPKGRGR